MKFLVLVLFARILVRQRSFFLDTIRLYNSLPQSAILPFTDSRGKCRRVDYVRNVLVVFNCTVNSFFKFDYLLDVSAPRMRQYDDTLYRGVSTVTEEEDVHQQYMVKTVCPSRVL